MVYPETPYPTGDQVANKLSGYLLSRTVGQRQRPLRGWIAFSYSPPKW